MNTEQAVQTLNDMCEALSALHCLDTLLDVALNADGGVLSDRQSGLHYLMKAQLESLGDGVELLRAFVKQPAHAAASGQLPEGRITPPIYRPGIEEELRAKAAASATSEKLRGADLEAVARDTNLAEATVRRVVDRLLAEPPGNPDRTASNG